MNILLPISRFAVPYLIGRGRPHSPLEALVLRGISEGLNSIDALQGAFRVHRRLLTEALVTLIQSGFVALGSGAQAALVITHEGDEALSRETPLRSAEISSPKHAAIFLDRLTGALAPAGEVRFLSTRELDGVWADTRRVPPVMHHNSIDEAQARPLLRTQLTEWVQWIGPSRLLAKEEWIPADFDPATATVIGVPDRWSRRLGPALAERLSSAGQRRHATRLTAGAARQADDSAWPAAISVRDDDLLLGHEAHRLAARSALETAKSSVFIASSVTTLAGVDELLSPILAAVKRGVRVDLLWRSSSEHSEVLSRLRKAKYDHGLDLLVFNAEPPRRALNLLVADPPEAAFAVIGGHLWLGADGETSALSPLSVSIHHPALVSQVCLAAVAALRSVPNSEGSSAPYRWSAIAASLDSAWSAAPDRSRDTTPTLVVGLDHWHIFRELSSTAQRRIIFVAEEADSLVAEFAADVPRQVEVKAEVSLSTAPRTPAIELLQPQFRAGILVSDDVALIGDYGLGVKTEFDCLPSVLISGAAVDTIARSIGGSAATVVTA